MANNLRNITELPVLTEVPDGTYTVVVDGGTAKLAPYGGGGGAEAIEVTYTTADMQTFTCDKTYEELYEALVVNNGIAVGKLMMGDVAMIGKTGLWSFANAEAVGGVGSAFVFAMSIGSSTTTLLHSNEDVITVER